MAVRAVLTNRMNQTTLTYLVVACAVIGIGGALVALLRTPRNQWFSVERVSIQDRLETLPPSREARVILGNRRAVLRRLLPWLLPACLLAYIGIANELAPESCATLFGYDSRLVNLLVFTYGLPGLFLLLAVTLAPTGFKVLRHGYFPPLDSAQLGDTIAEKGILSKIRGLLLILMPLYGLSLVVLGDFAYESMLNGRTTAEFLLSLERECLG